MTNSDMGMYVDNGRLAHFAENTARKCEELRYTDAYKTARRIRSALDDIKLSREKAAESFASTVHVPQEVEWLLDNWYIAEREGADAIHAFAHAGKIRYVKNGEYTALVQSIAAALIKSGENSLDEERMRIFLDSFQNVTVLTEKELSLFVPALKAALVTELRVICARMRGMLKHGENDKYLTAEREFRRAAAMGKSPDIATEKAAHTAALRHERLSLLMKNIFTSLRMLTNLNAAEVLESVSRVECTLRQDPSGEYMQMDDKTRMYYRRGISKLAEKRKADEFKTAKIALEQARRAPKEQRHIGNYIFKAAFGDARRKQKGGLYIGAIVLITLFFSLLTGFLTKSVVVTLLLLLPVWMAVKNIMDFFAVRFVPPDFIPRMELKDGVPDTARTLCAVSALISSKQSGGALASQLEEYMLANRDSGRNLLFGILADLPESKTEKAENDEKNIRFASDAIAALNEKYSGGFYLLLRDRTFNERDGKYMGWERKRGAILELARMLRGERSGLRCESGDASALKNVKYIIALDSDTRLCIGCAKEMIGAMQHPLNRPVVDKARNVVSCGRGLIQPRVSVGLESSDASDFARIFAGLGGVDTYGSAASDVYQDLFGKGTFTGKGIIDVDAYLECLGERFPENRILSHDLLEGEFLNAAYMSDVELLDGFPSGIRSYFERMHRWIRGDWQAAPWLLHKTKNAAGEPTLNPLGQVSRLKIFDNLVRSASPVFTFAALMIGMLTTRAAFTVAALIAVFSIASNLLLSSAEMAFRSGPGSRARYHSTIISGFAGGLLQTLIQLILLPYKAYISASAIVTALYRMLISKRNMLCWVTAAESEKRKKDTLGYYYLKMFVPVLAGAALVLFTMYPAAAAVGIVWIFSPVCAWSLSIRRGRSRGVSPAAKTMLLQSAGDIWRYFEEFLNEENNYLPPDNWQEQPAVGTAHRTSPTNIGLALLAAVSAWDLKLCTMEQALDIVRKITASVERLEKWNGNLYNWYDTRTMQPLHPAYVSAVDSGNLAGCLIAAIAAVSEMPLPDADETAAKLQKLLDAIDLGALYDDKRKLFHIGWDAEKNEPTQGWYDLMASEARQTSYIAIARGEVERKHWRRLGRMLVAQDRYMGMVSWTGTMFEYLMPNLLLPCYRNSLIYESSKFCVYVQKHAAVGKMPWGVSESAFYAFDPAMNYMYKAHGIGKLALRRGMEKDSVVSPYSSFLALDVDTAAAVKNLRHLKKLGMEGKYGFYEALDMTPSRQTTGDYEKVRTFMVHHLGMSIVAIDNAVNGEIMKRRFMSSREMAAHAELLQERVPIGQRVLRYKRREIPEKPDRRNGEGFVRRIRDVDYWRPFCCMLSNGAYDVLMTETGMSMSTWRGMLIKRYDAKRVGAAGGLSFFVRLSDKTVPLLPHDAKDDSMSFSSEFTGTHGRITAAGAEIETSAELTVPSEDMGELWTVKLKNTTAAPLQLRLQCVFEPVLTQARDYFAHPAFTKVKFVGERGENKVIMTRRAYGERKPASLCFACDRGIKTGLSRNAVWDRGELRDFIASGASAEGDPCVYAETELIIASGAEQTVRFALAVAERREDAEMAAERILRTPAGKSVSRVDMLAAKFELENPGKAFELLGHMAFAASDRTARSACLRHYEAGIEGLWKFGVSGDKPLLFGRLAQPGSVERAAETIKAIALLKDLGFDFDFAMVLDEGGSYRKPMRSAIAEILRRLGKENTDMVRLVDASEYEAVEALCANAAYEIDFESEKTQREKRREALPEVSKSRTVKTENAYLRHGFNGENEFVIESKGKLPERSWSIPLANENFGYIASDTGIGHMWYKNSRENKLTPWLNDPLAENGAETVKVELNGRKYSIFAAKDGADTRVTYGFGYAKWEKRINGQTVTSTVFVPLETDARVIITEIDGERQSGEIEYYAELLLGADSRASRFIQTWEEGGVLYAQNRSDHEYPDTLFSVRTNMKLDGFTFSAEAHAYGEYDGASGAGLIPCVSARYDGGPVCVIVCGCANDEELSALCKPENAARELQKVKAYWERVTGALRVSTPEKALDAYLNGWAVYQTLACRVTARTSIYQCGGAFGFRDQLQDVCSLIMAAPEKAEEQIIRAAQHQFEEGDVLHWWHSSALGEKGVRTRCSDDLLWLPYALCLYVERIGKTELCDVKAHYLHSAALNDREKERYELVGRSEISETLFEHAKKALDTAIGRGFGAHGLALIGTGDWNDGFDRVGARGKGESVWLTWFISIVSGMFSQLCGKLGLGELQKEYEETSDRCRGAAEKAWDGEWFLRGWYDDGVPLGCAKNSECSIDSLAQSFAVFARCEDKQKTESGLRHAADALYDRQNKLVKLFAPAFDSSRQEPGYIKSYAPGLRENGGQYTHGAIWLASACLRGGMQETGAEMLLELLPGRHDISKYKAEPYVIAADVYAANGCEGLAGWSWYTGAAGWYYRAATEDMLGIRLNNGNLTIEPKIPASWPGYEALLKTANGELHIEVVRGEIQQLTLDGKAMAENSIAIAALHGKHSARFTINSQ